MLNKIKNWALLILLGATVLLYSLYNTQRREKENARDIIEKLQSNPVTYRINEDSQTVAKVDVIEATESNMKALLASDKKLTKQVGKISRVNQALNLEYQVTGQLAGSGKDSLVIRDSVVYDTVKQFSMSDGYLSMNCTKVDDSLKCTYLYQDSLFTVTFLEKDWKWYQVLRWGKWKGVTEANFKNPNAKPLGILSVVRQK